MTHMVIFAEKKSRHAKLMTVKVYKIECVWTALTFLDWSCLKTASLALDLGPALISWLVWAEFSSVSPN